MKGLFLYCEEDILAERLLKIDGYAYYCANTSVIHLESMTVNREQRKKVTKKSNDSNEEHETVFKGLPSLWLFFKNDLYVV